MKYLLLIRWDSTVTLTAAEEAAMDASLVTWLNEMDGRGVRIEGHRLKEPVEGKVVRVRGGALSVTDGPFAETKEQIAGYDLLECADYAEAVEVASKHPVACYGAVEVREFFED
jgi:hypothetical protein